MRKKFIPHKADIIVGPGFFARFQTAPGEPPSYAGHIAGFTNYNRVMHALWRVRTDTWRRFKADHPKGFKVYRLRGIGLDITEQIAEKALELSARGYGWWRLLFHGADYAAAWALHLFGRNGELYFFRRALSNSAKWPVCHEVWARAYGIVHGYEFGKPWHLVNPDQMQDWMESHSEEWELVYDHLLCKMGEVA